MNHRSSSIAFGRRLGLVAVIAMLGTAAPARAAFITYNVKLTFDPNSSSTSTLGAAGPGTVTGTFTIDTSIPINSSTQSSGTQVTNLVSANLLEASNNGTILSGFSNSTTQVFNNVTPYQIFFIGSPVTIIPNSASLHNDVNGVLYELVSFSSPPIFDSIQVGPSIQFDFPYPVGGSVVPGNFDSIASTGFNAYLYGTVTPLTTSVPEPSSIGLLAAGLAGLAVALRRRRGWADRRPDVSGKPRR